MLKYSETIYFILFFLTKPSPGRPQCEEEYKKETTSFLFNNRKQTLKHSHLWAHPAFVALNINIPLWRQQNQTFTLVYFI